MANDYYVDNDPDDSLEREWEEMNMDLYYHILKENEEMREADES